MSVDTYTFDAEILSYSSYLQFFRGLHIPLYVSHRPSKLKLWVVVIILRNSGHGANLQLIQVTREQYFQEWNEHSNFSL